MIKNVKTNKGFLALFSVIIISFILISASVTLNFSGFFGRFNILDSESKMRSDALAGSCLDQARFMLTTNANFIGTGQTNLSNETCYYEVFPNGKIIAWAVVNNAHTYYQARLDMMRPEKTLLSFEECTAPTTCP